MQAYNDMFFYFNRQTLILMNIMENTKLFGLHAWAYPRSEKWETSGVAEGRERDGVSSPKVHIKNAFFEANKKLFDFCMEMEHLVAFYALFMTSKGQIVTQHEKKQQKTCLNTEIIWLAFALLE